MFERAGTMIWPSNRRPSAIGASAPTAEITRRDVEKRAPQRHTCGVVAPEAQNCYLGRRTRCALAPLTQRLSIETLARKKLYNFML